ncbi:MAG: hypothetical protein DRJ38_00035 [Thermoprotei archaeon]|nr:MAG: hypothetical protein DRJ38_00035 [Thermoprotei archaeon]
MSEFRPVEATFIYTPQNEVTLTESGGANPTHTSQAFDCERARTIVLQVIHNYDESESTDLDVLVYTSIDGVTFDTEPYTGLNIGSDTVKSIPISPGFRYAKIFVRNNDASHSTKVTTKLCVVTSK